MSVKLLITIKPCLRYIQGTLFAFQVFPRMQPEQPNVFPCVIFCLSCYRFRTFRLLFCNPHFVDLCLWVMTLCWTMFLFFFFLGASLCPSNWELFLLFGRVSSFIMLISNQYIFGVFIMALMYMLVHPRQVHMSASSKVDVKISSKFCRAYCNAQLFLCSWTGVLFSGWPS